MEAIRLCEKNRSKIRASIPQDQLPNEDLNAMIEEYGSRQDPLFFVPKFVPNGSYPSYPGGWATIPKTFFYEHYNAELPIDEMDHSFVKITHK